MNWWKTMQRFSFRETDDDPGLEEDPTLDEGDDPADGGGDPAPAVSGISREALPEELRNLPEAEVKFHLNQMVSGFRNQHSQVGKLREELEELRRRSYQEEAKPKEPDRPLEEEILDDPENAVMRVLEKRGLVQRFNRLEQDVGESAISMVASQIPDFKEYEGEVREILKQTGVPMTVDAIHGALQMAIGRKYLSDGGRERRKQHKVDSPKPEAPKKTSKYGELSGLEAEIFQSSGMSREEWEKNKNPDFDIEVPTS